MPELDDIALLRQYAENGSETAFAALVERHVNLVYSVALRRVGHAPAAEEITQAVFVILARKARGLSPSTVLTGWLYQTARLTAANFLRGEIRRQRREQEAFMQSTLNESGADAWSQIAPILEDAMAGLGERDRNAILLRFFENKDLRAVGAALGGSEDAARMRVNRALEKLRNFFVKRGITLSATMIGGAVLTNSVHAAPVGLAPSVAAVAATKGAAVSSSTLTLVKGVLRIMAWTKAKTAVVASIGVLLVAGTTTVTVKEVAAHRTDELWRVPNPNPDRAPMMVEILPTKFTDTVEALNVGNRGDNWVGVGQSALQIARVAYGWRPGRIVFTGDQPTGRYDFISTLPTDSGTVLQAELKKKLGLVGYREMRNEDVLLLKVARPGAPGLQPPVPGGHADYIRDGHYHCDNSPISSNSGWYPGITRFLENDFGMPVIDQTGLTQNYYINLTWDERGEIEADHNALKQALLGQLGFRLVPTNMPIEMLVVEKAK